MRDAALTRCSRPSRSTRDGLVPVIAQEARTGMVRMLAWANRDALAATLATGAAHFWSRSRQASWRKGESVGEHAGGARGAHRLRRRRRAVPVRSRGPVLPHRRDVVFLPPASARPTTARWSRDDGPADPPALVVARVAEVIARRRRERPEKSYVVSLLDAGLPKINGKIAEEAGELTEALLEERRAHIAHEAADLIFHVLVGLEAAGRADRRRVRGACAAGSACRASTKRRAASDDRACTDLPTIAARRRGRASVRCSGPAGRRRRCSPATRRARDSWRWRSGSPSAIDGDERLLVEAGTGTGKTLAYLVPALLSGRKVVVSTGTKTLQDQIATVDLPRLRAMFDRAGLLPAPLEWAVMKGLSNYVCRRRLGERDRQRSLIAEPELDRLLAFAASSPTGDRADLPDLADDAPLWGDIAATPETRIGPRCAFFETLLRDRRCAAARPPRR